MPAPAKKSNPAREADGRKQEIVQAAYAQIAEVGLEGLRTRDVAARVGINIATLHYYFPSKQELVVAVVRHVNEMFRSLRIPVAEGASVVDSVVRTARHRKQVAPELGVVLLELGVRSARDEAVAAAMSHNQTEWRDWLAEQIRQEVAAGILRADLDARSTAALLASLVIGSTMQLQMNPTAFDQEALFKHLDGLIRAPKKKGKR